MAGKGDRPRPVDRELFNRNFDRIFGTGKRKDDKSDSPAEVRKSEEDARPGDVGSGDGDVPA